MSFPPDDLASLYAFNAWANARVLETLRALPEARLREGAGRRLAVAARHVRPHRGRDGRLGRALRREGRDAPSDGRGASDASTTRSRVLLAAQEKHARLLPTYDAARLAGPFTWKNLKGEAKTAPFWVVVRHVVNHQTYHRGQISSMLRRLGHAPKSTDMVVWGIEIAAGA